MDIADIVFIALASAAVSGAATFFACSRINDENLRHLGAYYENLRKIEQAAFQEQLEAKRSPSKASDAAPSARRSSSRTSSASTDHGFYTGASMGGFSSGSSSDSGSSSSSGCE